MEQAVLSLHLMLIAIGTGASFSNLVNVRLARSQGQEAARGLAIQRRTISQIGDGVITLIWLTGLVLLWMRPATWSPWLWAKIAVVVVLTLCHALVRRTGGEVART